MTATWIGSDDGCGSSLAIGHGRRLISGPVESWYGGQHRQAAQSPATVDRTARLPSPTAAWLRRVSSPRLVSYMIRLPRLRRQFCTSN
jgi:hypothetical protein